MMKRVLAAASVLALTVSITGLAACSSDGEGAPITDEQLAQAHVAIGILDDSGNQVGEGAGVLIAPNAVLTSAHLVAGNSRWAVKTADGKTAYGVRGKTYDWMSYDSDKSHPRKHDVAVLYLDRPIARDAYPTITSDVQKTGTAVKRIRHDGTSFASVDATLSTVRTFPHAYVTDMAKSEKVDTGGAVINDNNEIVAIVTGRGTTTGKLYLARVQDLSAWLAPKVACATNVALFTSGASTKTYGTPPPPKAGCDGGDASTDDDGGDTTDSDGGGGGGGGTCNDGPGPCSGDCPVDTPTTDGGSPDDDGGGGGGGGSSSGATGVPVGSSGPDSDGDTEVCEGPTDNPEDCPPEPPGCVGPDCGGGSPDDLIDYGNCNCSSSSSTGTPKSPH